MNRIVINGNSIQCSGNNVTIVNDELVERLLVEYANKPKSNVEVIIR